MAPGGTRPCHFPCQNLPLSSAFLSLGSPPSCNPIPAPAPVPALVPAPIPASVPASIPAPAPTNELFKKFMKAYLESNQRPRQPPEERKQIFKAKISEVYYSKLHMDCYHFYQQCKDYFKIAGATGFNWTPFAAFFLCGNISVY